MPLYDPAPHQAVLVQQLEELTEQARQGRLLGAIVLVQWKSGSGYRAAGLITAEGMLHAAECARLEIIHPLILRGRDG